VISSLLAGSRWAMVALGLGLIFGVIRLVGTLSRRAPPPRS
jgi:branched-subunit amino acid ABC-type transport system permease component